MSRQTELERWGPRSKPKVGPCSRCRDTDTVEYLDLHNNLCRTCVGLDQLQHRMITQGKMHPQLIPPNTAPERADRQLPPSDR